MFATGMVVASTSTVEQRLPAVAIAMVLLGSGMGLALAPSTESIMGSLPRDKAGVGSRGQRHQPRGRRRARRGGRRQHAVVDLRRPVRSTTSRPALPASARDAADDSLGAALGVSGQLGSAGAGIADAAREAFVYAMSRASLRDRGDRGGRRVRGVALPAGARDRRGRTPTMAAPTWPTCRPRVSRCRRGRPGSSARCRRGRSSRRGSSPGTAGGSPRRSRRWARAGSRW